MKIYKAEKFGTLLVVRGCLEGREGRTYPKLLVDTRNAFRENGINSDKVFRA